VVEPQNQGGRGFPGLCLKTDMHNLMIWVSKSPRRFFDLCLKTNYASVCRLCHKTDGGVGAGHISRSSGLLHVKANQARVSQSGLNTGGGTMMGDAHGTITKVASESN
jgi:hypothetical protein